MSDHGDLCWGCGPINPFGLHLELEPAAEGLAGRFFVKQDLQGPDGTLHHGVLAGVLHEALGRTGPVSGVEMSFAGQAPVGTFVVVEVSADEALARREEDGAVLARARRRDGG